MSREGFKIRVKLRELRESLGVTQMEFANKYGYSQGTYQKYESGTTNIPVELLVKLSNDGYNLLKRTTLVSELQKTGKQFSFEITFNAGGITVKAESVRIRNIQYVEKVINKKHSFEVSFAVELIKEKD